MTEKLDIQWGVELSPHSDTGVVVMVESRTAAQTYSAENGGTIVHRLQGQWKVWDGKEEPDDTVEAGLAG